MTPSIKNDPMDRGGAPACPWRALPPLPPTRGATFSPPASTPTILTEASPMKGWKSPMALEPPPTQATITSGSTPACAAARHQQTRAHPCTQALVAEPQPDGECATASVASRGRAAEHARRRRTVKNIRRTKNSKEHKPQQNRRTQARRLKRAGTRRARVERVEWCRTCSSIWARASLPMTCHPTVAEKVS
jgi:hypothetical protein